MRNQIFLIVLLGLFAASCSQVPKNTTGCLAHDEPFRQATSVKFKMADELKGATLKKIVVDYRDNLYLLTDKGVYRDFDGNLIVKDYTYASLSSLVPLDITIQAETGYMYYLYEDGFLTNAHAGTIYAHFPPKSYQRIVVNTNDQILLLGDKQATLYDKKDKITDVTLPEGRLVKVMAQGADFYYQTSAELYKFDGKTFISIHKGEKEMTAFAVDKEKIYIGTREGFYTIGMNGRVIDALNDKLPVVEIRDILLANGQPWFTTPDGAFVKEQDRNRYFAYERWMDDNNILSAAASSTGDLFFMSAAAVSEVKYMTHTLAQKAEVIQTDLRKNHIRFGWSVAADFAVHGDPTTLSLRDDDNDGLWTSIYLGSQAFRYATTGEEVARRNVWESFEAFERNLTVTGLKGFSARTFERKGFVAGDKKPWRQSPEDEWEWKGTTSSDEFVGYIFVASVMDRFICKTDAEHKRVADYIATIMDHIIANNYTFTDYDGQPTLWARWNPEFVNGYPETVYDRKLNSYLLLAGYQVAYALTKDQKYKQEADKALHEWGYLENIKRPLKSMVYTDNAYHLGHQMGTEWNHSDDEMAFLTYYPLMWYAFDDEMKKIYTELINEHWELEAPERNGLWNVMTYGLTGKIDLESTLWWLREYNLDRHNYFMKNSHRKDIEVWDTDPQKNFRQQPSNLLLTQGEQRQIRHNTNGFVLDEGSKGYKFTGEEFLLPYWMCRYYKVID